MRIECMAILLTFIALCFISVLILLIETPKESASKEPFEPFSNFQRSLHLKNESGKGFYDIHQPHEENSKHQKIRKKFPGNTHWN